MLTENDDGNDGRWCIYKPEVYCQEYHCDCCILNFTNPEADWRSWTNEYRHRLNGPLPIELEHAMRIN